MFSRHVNPVTDIECFKLVCSPAHLQPVREALEITVKNEHRAGKRKSPKPKRFTLVKNHSRNNIFYG